MVQWRWSGAGPSEPSRRVSGHPPAPRCSEAASVAKQVQGLPAGHCRGLLARPQRAGVDTMYVRHDAINVSPAGQGRGWPPSTTRAGRRRRVREQDAKREAVSWRLSKRCHHHQSKFSLTARPKAFPADQSEQPAGGAWRPAQGLGSTAQRLRWTACPGQRTYRKSRA